MGANESGVRQIVSSPFMTEPAPSTRRAVFYAFGQRYLAFVVQLATSIILARLLTPQETGVFSLAVAAVAIGTILREFGTTDYVVSQKDISPEKLRAAYTVTVGFAWATAAVLFVAAYPLAAHYNEPGLATVMHVLCLNFMLVPLGSTATALLTKSLRFDVLFWIQTISVVASALVTVGCAMAGLSSQSPAWGSVAGIATTVGILFVRNPRSVLMVPGLHDLRHVLRFGGTLTVARIIESMANRSPDFIVSGMLGFHSGGVLSKANSLNAGFYDFFASAVVRVATPVLAAARHGNTAVAQGYRHAIVMMAAVQWLFFGLMGITAPELVLVLFGNQWLQAVPILQIGAVQGLIYAPFMLCIPLLTACGAAAAQLRINLIYGVVLVAALAIGCLHSLTAAAALSVGAHLVRMALFSVATREQCGISTRSVVAGLGPTAVVCAFAALCALATRVAMNTLGGVAWVTLAATVSAAVVAFLSAAAIAKHPLTGELRRLWGAIIPKFKP
jgi:O-antigen/teichoic acid export membrane protein